MKLARFAVSSALLSMSNGEATCQDSVCQAEDEQALLQIHTPISGGSKSKGKAVLATMLLQTTKDITDKVNSGQDPTECSQALNTVHEALTSALPNIYSQHQHHQNIIDLAVQNVEECASREVDGVAMVAQQGVNLQTARSNHASCRQREDAREGEEYCDQFRNLRNTHGPEMCHALPEDEESIAWVNAVEAARDAAQTALDEGRRLQEECQNFRDTHVATQNECTQGQSQFELDYCAHRASCADLEICRATADENYMSVTAEVEAAMEDVVAEFLVLKHVECLLGQANAALATSSTVSTDECNTAASTDELIINYPSVAAIDTCESTVLTRPPCKSAFFDAEYASFGQREAMEEACVECSALPLAGAPTAWIRRHGLSHIDLDNLQCAQGSPSGCTATQVQLNGEYSPGPLVRVDNGNTVYRSTDADSCPPGFKIYSPRTQEDWRTIEASINFGEFNSPHHIVDVTRPANGCGGCTGNAMNSDNQAQSSWVTSDGSPWFLRAHAYGEPNGDYTTNCYLHLWSPHNGEVHFNDGSCSYHSNRYLCQVRTDYEPPAAAGDLDLELTPCGAVGGQGPDQTQCSNIYAGTDASSVEVPHRGYQVFTAPYNARVTIEAHGARGGHNHVRLGGYGATTTAECTVSAGERIVVAVGQKGWDNPNNADWGGGGGGATWVAKEVSSGGDTIAPLGLQVELLTVAGGGSGQNDNGQCHSAHNEQTEGGRGIGGNPDQASVGGQSGGGGGFKADGSGGARSFLNGAIGDVTYGQTSHCGGFGGGGRPYNGGGGGGGYQGGDCNIGDSRATDCRCHGGTSFGESAVANNHDGDGSVRISFFRMR